MVEQNDAPPKPDIIWARPERGSRGPRPSTGRFQIATAAIRLADAEGLDAVSMRRVAAELELAPAALYRYVQRKDELHELMVDAVFAGDIPPHPSGSWRVDLAALAHRSRAAAFRHPWLTELSAQRTPLGPGSLKWMEFAFGAFDGHRISADDILTNVETLTAFVTGHVLAELAEHRASDRTGVDHEQWMTAMSAYGETIIGSGRWPRVARIMIEAEGPHDPDHLERTFQLGVDRILDGMAGTVR